ncbi:hypothetical protein [Sinomonas sp. G460-2]|uniref:hypothetical protein n=1 Tax=Sinomonas sp. G460-2 TaxID=3393464 RepID=UPI0039F0F9BE
MDDLQIGMLIDTGRDLEPGSQTIAKLSFWAPEGQVFAVQGADFRIWYAGRIVGEGRVLEVIPDLV